MGRLYLFTGSKVTGGFYVTREGLLKQSKLGHILTETPTLLNYASRCGQFIRYKGRSYCWVDITKEDQIRLTEEMMNFLQLEPGKPLLCIRSSDIAFTMGAKGPLLEKSRCYEAGEGKIPEY